MKELLINYNKNLEGRFENFWAEVGDIHQKSILLYPSSRFDLRPIVILMDKEIERLNSQGKNLPKIDNYIYTNLEPELLNSILHKQNDILFQDGKTKITLKEIIPTIINRDVFTYYVSSDNYEFAHYYNLTDRGFLPDSAILKVRIESKTHGVQDSWILFFEAENINFFEQVVLKYSFPVSYLCNVYEGLAWGGCNKSFTEYFLKDYLNRNERTFEPKFILRNEDYVIEELEKGKDYKERFHRLHNGECVKLNMEKQYSWDDQPFGRYANLYQISYPG